MVVRFFSLKWIKSRPQIVLIAFMKKECPPLETQKNNLRYASDSNSRPRCFESDALPTVLTRLVRNGNYVLHTVALHTHAFDLLKSSSKLVWWGGVRISYLRSSRHSYKMRIQVNWGCQNLNICIHFLYIHFFYKKYILFHKQLQFKQLGPISPKS